MRDVPRAVKDTIVTAAPSGDETTIVASVSRIGVSSILSVQKWLPNNQSREPTKYERLVMVERIQFVIGTCTQAAKLS